MWVAPAPARGRHAHAHTCTYTSDATWSRIGKASTRQLVQRQVDFSRRLWHSMLRGDAVRLTVHSVSRTTTRLVERARAYWMPGSSNKPEGRR
jgi:hypothetical protein